MHEIWHMSVKTQLMIKIVDQFNEWHAFLTVDLSFRQRFDVEKLQNKKIYMEKDNLII